MKEKAVNYFKQGYSCSESIIKMAIDEGLCDKSLLAVATAFSGGMSSGCLCGAVAGSQIVLGANFGKENGFGNEEIARAKAKEFIDEFKKTQKATCCRVLSAGHEFHSPERKNHCTNIVAKCAEILENYIKTETKSNL